MNDYIHSLEIAEELKDQLRIDFELNPVELEPRMMADISQC